MKTAIVTGAARGIGKGISDALSHAGWHVHRLDIEVRDGIIPCDVSDETSVGQAFERIGADRLDLLVNNAGVAGPTSGPIEELSLDDWNKWIGTNLTGAFLTTRAAVPALRQAGGSVVNIASTRAFMSEAQTEAYAASKGGLFAFTHALAISLGPAIRANAIAPGWIATGDEELREVDHEQHPAGRVGQVGDIADAVLWLADAGFVTGETIVIDGGMTRKMIYAE
jgi:NAD(P)-dependent dehydrogenase (short-subunit alcohol dehydrogenase family)